jgi:hypothetical protein
VPGEYINVSKIATNTEIEVEMDLMIPLSRILLFRNLRWIADWMGSWELELFPTHQNILVAPVIPEAVFTLYPQIQTAIDAINNATPTTDTANQIIDLGFHHLNQSMRNRFTIETNGNITFHAAHKFTSERNQETRDPKLRLATFYLHEHVSKAIRDEYSKTPFLFPMQEVLWSDFTQYIHNNASFTPSAQHNFKCTDAAYILLKEDATISTQRFVNPCIRYQLNVGGAVFPRESYNTSYDHRNTNQILDTFNINNSLTSSISEDLRTSLQRYVKYTDYDATGKSMRKYHWTTGDQGRSFISIPFCDSGVFQGGLSIGDVTVTLEGSRMDSRFTPEKLAEIKYHNFVLVTTNDRIMIIRNHKPDGLKQVEVVTFSFDELMRANG